MIAQSINFMVLFFSLIKGRQKRKEQQEIIKRKKEKTNEKIKVRFNF